MYLSNEKGWTALCLTLLMLQKTDIGFHLTIKSISTTMYLSNEKGWTALCLTLLMLQKTDIGFHLTINGFYAII